MAVYDGFLRNGMEDPLSCDRFLRDGWRVAPRRVLCCAAALVSALAGALRAQVVINEIHYETDDKNVRGEFIELHNAGEATVDVSGWYFSEGISLEIDDGTEIPPDGYLVVAEDPETIRNTYGDVAVVGPWSGRLENDGEAVTLRDASGELIDQVDYRATFPWPIAPAGTGASMELINPALDNDLGGSWRPSGASALGLDERVMIVGPADTGWRFRKGTSEPPQDWRDAAFVEDDSWRTGRTPIGFGDDDDNTVLDDMRDGYTSVYMRRVFMIPDADAIPRRLALGVYVDDGAIVWLNGRQIGRFHVSDGDKSFDDVASSHEARDFEEIALAGPATLLRPGENVIAVHAMNSSIRSSDFSIDVSLFMPADDELGESPPSPGVRNSAWAENAPPQIRQVDTLRRMPASGQLNIVTAKITDPDGVAAVELRYQIVPPGGYIPAFLPVPIPTLMANASTPRPPNPEFEDPANWTVVSMTDDGTGADEIAGDDIYAAIVPAQPNRTLVRYRIRAVDTAGASILAPYADDPSLNFAYFVHDGVPDYHATTSINGEPTTHSALDLTSIAVYFLITRNQDIVQARAGRSQDQIPQGNQARFAENWEAAFVYEGFVYDHVTYRLRGANGRYQVPPGTPTGTTGKRHWRIRFNKGNHLRARDRWGRRHPTRWKWLNTGRMFGNRIDGNWGLGDQVNDIIWNAYGVPAAYGHAFHWRVVDGQEEVPAGARGQYEGDFWGIARAFENYDVRFLEAHDLPKGNLYKLVNQTRSGLEQRRYHAPGAVSRGEDHDNIERNLGPSRTDNWLIAHVDYGEWFRYHAIAQAIRHYDYWPEANKNAAWYFYPDFTPANNSLGRMWTLPFDADATWGPTWNEGRDRPWDAIFGGVGKPAFQLEYRNQIREVRDLLWQRDQLEQVIRQTAAFMHPLEAADIDRWRNGTIDSGRQFFSAANQRTLEGKVQDMLRFAFTGGNWPGGGVPAGGRARFLDDFADARDRRFLPERPEVVSIGDPGFPLDGLMFRSSAFADPQGSGTFGAMTWRVAEVWKDPGSRPLSDPIWKSSPVPLELTPVWESEKITTFDPEITLPVGPIREGGAYRVRVRMEDQTGVWSHWSEPVEFTAGPPAAPIPVAEHLRVTEIMYNPPGGADFEFIELQNTGTAPLDLTRVRFTDGVDLDFGDDAASGVVDGLGPGEVIVVVRDLETFSRRYDTSAIRVAGEYGGRLDNAGELIALSLGEVPILGFSYDDAWFPETDGLGYSLELIDTGVPVAELGEPASWSSSRDILGSPGRVEPGSGPAGGLLRPADANVDGVVNISDAVALLALLFSRAAGSEPCEGDIDAGGNLVLLDVNGDQRVDVTDPIVLLEFLFLRGPAPALGVDCVRIEGCPSACARR